MFRHKHFASESLSEHELILIDSFAKRSNSDGSTRLHSLVVAQDSTASTRHWARQVINGVNSGAALKLPQRPPLRGTVWERRGNLIFLHGMGKVDEITTMYTITLYEIEPRWIMTLRIAEHMHSPPCGGSVDQLQRKQDWESFGRHEPLLKVPITTEGLTNALLCVGIKTFQEIHVFLIDSDQQSAVVVFLHSAQSILSCSNVHIISTTNDLRSKTYNSAVSMISPNKGQNGF